MKTRFISLLIIAFVALTTSSCLNDEYLYDYDDQQPVIEFPQTNHYEDLDYSAGDTSTSSYIIVNYTIANWKDIDEDIPVVVSIDESYMDDGYTLFPSGSYDLTFPLTMTIEDAETQAAEYTRELDGSTSNKYNRQSAQTVITFDLTQLTEGTSYALPLAITSVPSGYTISGNYGYYVYYLDY